MVATATIIRCECIANPKAHAIALPDDHRRRELRAHQFPEIGAERARPSEKANHGIARMRCTCEKTIVGKVRKSRAAGMIIIGCAIAATAREHVYIVPARSPLPFTRTCWAAGIGLETVVGDEVLAAGHERGADQKQGKDNVTRHKLM